ncbi:MAG: hypothetical protein IIA33_06715 [Planctomycetes bacterium]|nr:hypothetical protein [Planctomycetota bacterium]
MHVNAMPGCRLFAVVAEPHRVSGELKKRFAGTIDRVFCTFPFAKEEERRAFIEELRAG